MQAIWEGRAEYADMYILLCGHEKIGVTNAQALKVIARKPEEDFIGYKGPVEVWLPMTPEDVLIVYPEDKKAKKPGSRYIGCPIQGKLTAGPARRPRSSS